MSAADVDSLACPYPDCITYVGHNGPHEFSWGDSIPWPPGADLDDGQPVTYCSTECASHRCTRPCGRVTEHPADEAGHICDDCASAIAGWF